MNIKFGKKDLMDFSNIGFLEAFLPLYSILIYYPLPFFGSVGQIVMYTYVLVHFLTHKNIRFTIPKWQLYFTIYVIPLQIIIFHYVGGFDSSRLINIIMIILYLIVLSYFKVNIDGLLKMYKLIGFIASVLILIQFVQIFFMNQIVHQIMLLPMEIPSTWYSEGLRPQGLFPEPQVYATFILPLLIFNIKNNEYMWAVFFSVSIMASTSTLGILCVVGIWGYYMVFSKLSSTKKFLILSIGIIGVVVVIRNSLFEYALEKISATNFFNNVRLTRGFFIWLKLPLLNKLFGIGVNNLSYFMESGQLVLRDIMTLGMTNPAYITSAYELLIHFGLFATIIYVGMLINLFKNSELRVIVILLFILSFGQTILFSGVWYLYMVIILASIREKNESFLIFKKKD